MHEPDHPSLCDLIKNHKEISDLWFHTSIGRHKLGFKIISVFKELTNFYSTHKLITSPEECKLLCLDITDK